MSIRNLYLLGSVQLGETLLSGITTYDVDPGVATAVVRGDARVDPGFAAVLHQSPVLSFGTTAIAQMLGVTGLGGLGILDDGFARFYLQRLQQGGTRAATGRAMVVQAGIVVPRALTASQGGVASMAAEVFAISLDGAVAPILVEDEVTVPAPGALARQFTVGPVVFGETARVNGVTRTTIDPGLAVVVRGDEGQAYDSFAAIRSRGISLTVRATDLDQIPASDGTNNAFVGTGPLTVYLRGLRRNGLPYADDEAQHVGLTLHDCLVYVRSVGGDEDEEQELEMTVEVTAPEDPDDPVFTLESSAEIPGE